MNKLEFKVLEYLHKHDDAMNEHLNYAIAGQKIKVLKDIIDATIKSSEEVQELRDEISELQDLLDTVIAKITKEKQRELDSLNEAKNDLHEHIFVEYKTTDDHDGWSRVDIGYTHYEQCCVCGEKRTRESISKY